MSNYRDPRYCNITLDANSLRIKDKTSSALVDEFQRYTEILKLSVIIPHGVQREIGNPNTPKQAQQDMDEIYSDETNLTSEEQERLRKLEELMTGNAQSQKHIADANHLFEASKYVGGYFVTHDKRILKKQSELSELAPGLNVVTLQEIVEICKRVENQQE